MDLNAHPVEGIIFTLTIIAMGVWLVSSISKKLLDLLEAREVARADRKNLEGYRALAEEATRAHGAVLNRLDKLDDIDARLADVERMLREVDTPTFAR